MISKNEIENVKNSLKIKSLITPSLQLLYQYSKLKIVFEFDNYDEYLYSNLPLVKIFSNLLLCERKDFKQIDCKKLIYDCFNNIHMVSKQIFIDF